MTSVEIVKNICKSRKIPIYRLEKDLGYSNGYISQLRKGVFPSDRLTEIAAYLDVPLEMLLGSEPENSETAYRVPVLGRVAAGIPLFAAEEIIDWEELPKIWKHKGDYFGLQIQGNSMEPRMCDGDVVIVRQQETCESGQTAIVMVNGDEATCKRVVFHENGLTLVSNNPVYAPRFFTSEEVEKLPVRIIGVVAELRAKFN